MNDLKIFNKYTYKATGKEVYGAPEVFSLTFNAEGKATSVTGGGFDTDYNAKYLLVRCLHLCSIDLPPTIGATYIAVQFCLKALLETVRLVEQLMRGADALLTTTALQDMWSTIV